MKDEERGVPYFTTTASALAQTALLAHREGHSDQEALQYTLGTL